MLPAILYLATVLLFAFKRWHLPASRGFELHRWETPVLVLALAYIVLELAIFYFAYLLVCRGRHGLTMPGMQSIDMQATAPQRAKETM